MNEPTIHSAIPGSISHKLGLVRQRKMIVHMASALVAAMAVLLAAMGVAMLIDWLATLYDSRWRVVLTLAAFLAAGLTTLGWLTLVWRRGLRWRRVAADVDARFPLLEERWSTVTQLHSDDASNPEIIHPAMLRRVADEAARWEPQVEPEQVVSLSPLMRTMVALTAISAVLAVAVVLDARQTFVLMRRFWLPASSISATELVSVPGNIVIGRGEPLALEAEIKGTPVERAVLFLRDDRDATRTVSLVARGQDPIAFSHRFRSVDEPFAYRFRAGDGQTAWYNVAVADRPEIDKLQLTVTPPAYTGRKEKSFNKLPTHLSALEKSELQLAILPDRPVETVELNLGGNKVVRLAPDADGWYRWKKTLEDGFSLAPLLTESHGLTNHRVPKCRVSVYPDKPPAVKVISPDDQMEVRPDDTVQIMFTAQDDVGIGAAELLIYDESAPVIPGEAPLPIATITIPLADQVGARSVQQSVNLNMKQLGFEDGSEFSYEIRVREDRGGMAQERVATPQQTESPSPGQLVASTPSSANSTMPSAAPSGSSSSTSRSSAQPNTSSTSGSPTKQQTALTQQTAQPGTPPARSTETTAANQPPNSVPDKSQPTELDKSARVAMRDELPSHDPSVNLHPDEPPSKSGSLATNRNETSDRSKSRAVPDSSQQANAPADRPNDRGVGNDNKMANKPADSAIGKDSATPSESAKPSASQTASEAAPKNGGPSDEKVSPEQVEARTATTARRALSAKSEDAEKPADPAASLVNQPNPQSPSGSAARSQMASNLPKRDENQPSERNDRQSKSSANQSPIANQMAANSGSQKSQSSPSDRPPGDSMTRRVLDVQPQEASSKRMRLKVDQWAGSFEGQQREKLQMAIAPELEALDQALAKAERTARGVLDDLGRSGTWQGRHDRDVSSAEKFTVEGQEVIGRLKDKSKDTPYAFIGLQATDIGLAHVNPARSGFWKALQSEGDDRIGSVRNATQHLARARQMVAELKGQFVRAQKEYEFAESVERVKKMYQVYIEDSLALLKTQADDPTRYSRKMAQFDLDEEYMKRLKEVLEMRRDLQAELARILADDPRLLRRFMDSLKNRTHSLREELADLVARQVDLNREVRAWTLVEETERPRIAKILMLRQVQDASQIAIAAGELQSRYQAWLPLNRESKDADLAAATKRIQDVATVASELNASCQSFIAEAQKPVVSATPAEGDNQDNPAENATKPPRADPAPLVGKGEQLYRELNSLEVALRQLTAREEGMDTAGFAANRLVETRRLVADTSAWVRQMRAHQAGTYPRAAEVDQYRLAMKTDELAGKLGSIEQALAGIMQRSNGTLPEPIANKAREFLTTLDKQVSPNQLASVYALHSDQMTRAVVRQKAAGEALNQAEKLYDDMIRMVIEELDKLPVQDPIASLLDDPTLDELLAQLEQEFPVQELLGIPNRPSNLQIIGDWLTRTGDAGIATGSGQQMIMNQFRQNQQQMQRRLDQAYRRAIARALKEVKTKPPVRIPKATTLSDWNQLVSKLGDDIRQSRDKAPPERYRRAIEQYFSQISGVVAEQEAQEK